MAFDFPTLFNYPIKTVSCNIPVNPRWQDGPFDIGTFSISLVRDPNIQPSFANTTSLIGTVVDFSVGSMFITGRIVAVDEILVNVGGTGTINLSLKELVVDRLESISGELNALSVDQLLVSHDGEISSVKRGVQLRESDPRTIEWIFQFNEKVRPGRINETTRIEAAGFPKSNIPRFYNPSFDTLLRRLGSSESEWNAMEAEFKSLTGGIQLSASVDPLEIIEIEPAPISRFDFLNWGVPIGSSLESEDRTDVLKAIMRDLLARSIVLRRQFYRRLVSPDPTSRGPEQINVQINNNGVTTSYVYNKAPSEIDERIKNLEDTWNGQASLEEDRKLQRDRIIQTFFTNLPRWDEPVEFTRPDTENDNKSNRDDGIEQVVDTLGRLELERMIWDTQKPTGGLGVIVGPAGGGPFYVIRRQNNVDIDSQTFSRFGPGMFVSEWSRVRNLAEPENSLGLLAPGTSVTVSIFKERESSVGVPVIEQSPQTFAPPLPEA